MIKKVLEEGGRLKVEKVKPAMMITGCKVIQSKKFCSRSKEQGLDQDPVPAKRKENLQKDDYEKILLKSNFIVKIIYNIVDSSIDPLIELVNLLEFIYGILIHFEPLIFFSTKSWFFH